MLGLEPAMHPDIYYRVGLETVLPPEFGKEEK